MMTFFMFGKYSAEAVKEISANRTAKSQKLMKKFGGKIKSIYALIGDWDLVLIVELPGVTEAMKASVALSKMSKISFSTSPAIPVEQFDKIMSKMK
ncbi:GYD domain-containing protein [Candidatus Sumerlaeota bacterium]|nr:GYD domain-containing protein [Candidatus Sumerlaeota bacterium]